MKFSLKRPAKATPSEDHAMQVSSSSMEIRIKLEEYSIYMKQLEMIRLTEEDLMIISPLYPIVQKHLQQIVDSFYTTLLEVPHLRQLIESKSTIERLQQTLERHIQEMFSGVIDDEYVAKRIRVAHAHVRIGLEPKWYIAAFQNLLGTLYHVMVH